MNLNRVRLTRLISAVLLVALTAIAWLFVLQPRQGVLAQADADLLAARDQQAALVSRSAQLRQLLAQAPDIAASAQALFEAVPQTAELPALLEQITTAATDAGIAAEDISVINTSIPVPIADADPAAAQAAEELGVSLGSIAVDVSVTGSADELLAFQGNLENLERALVIESVSMSASQDQTQAQTMSIAGRLFILRSKLPDLVERVDALVAEASGSSDQ